MHDFLVMPKHWEDIQELLGNTKTLKIQILPEEFGYGIRLVGDKNTRSFRIKKKASHPVDIFDLKFQVPKNKKSPFPYQLPSVEINLDTLEEKE